MEEALKDKFPTSHIRLVKSSGGDFKIIVQKQLIFDKLSLPKEQQEFPTAEEIISRILKLEQL